jgi:hypothetical protein
MTQRWLQIQGDPSVRRFLFEQERVDNDFDAELEAVLARVETLMLGHGVFHAKIDFSSRLVTFWVRPDPLRYRVHVKEEFMHRTIFALYPRAPYPAEAVMPADAVRAVLNQFKRLRRQDRTVYLRSASLNVVSGCVSVSFSCDGSHYLDYAEFLQHASKFRC